VRWALAGALVVLVALPAVLSSYALTLFILIFFYAFLGQAWNIVGGYAGQLSAGHAAFVGVGGYTAAMLSIELGLTPWIGMLIGGALAALLGAIIGYLGFRFGLRGFYFVLLTVAFAEICRVAVSNIDALGGPLGLYITFTGNPRQFQEVPGHSRVHYIALGLHARGDPDRRAIERRRFGIYLAAIREDEAAAEALGVNAFKYRCWRWSCRRFSPASAGRSTRSIFFSLQPNAFALRYPLCRSRSSHRPIVGGAGRTLRADPRLVIADAAGRKSPAALSRAGGCGAH
jgi:branched-chain amino acid transport system permease protein